MNPVPVTETGGLLWRLLPLIYRRWDGTHGKDPKHPVRTPEQRGDLAEFLDAHGVLFDLIRGTLDQRLLDTSPNTCQPWLIPYFADLLDVRLVSPDINGQREEVARAVSWRQRKGTIGCTAEIAQEVGRFERTVVAPPDGDADGRAFSDTFRTLHIQEGFRRVVTTARIGLPLPSLRALGLPPDAFEETSSPIDAAKRPGLPGGTVDFRQLSRAREIKENSPVSQINAFGSDGVRWQQENPTGVPCYRDTYQDVSVRTVDVRTPGWAQGHYHPRRSLVYSAPRDGFFPPGQFEVSWSDLIGWFAAFDSAGGPIFTEWEDELGKLIRERALPPITRDAEEIVFIERFITDLEDETTRYRIAGRRKGPGDPRRDYRIERVGADTGVGADTYLLVSGFELVDADGGMLLSLAGFGEKPPRITADGEVELSALGFASAYALDGFVFDGHLVVRDAMFALRRVAIERLTAHVAAAPGPSEWFEDPELSIVDSLIETLVVSGDGLCRLEYCTVLKALESQRLEASDCVLRSEPEPPAFSELNLRYCCAPWAPLGPIDASVGRLYEPTITRDQPRFLNEIFGEPGCGVLHPGAVTAIREGAEDGGELGAYHHLHFVLREEALIDKLRDFLPVTQEPVLIPHGSWVRPVVRPPTEAEQ